MLHTRRLKRQTVRSRLPNLSALFEYAVKKKLIKTNPVRAISRIDAPPDPNPDYLTEDEEAKLLSLTEEQRYPWLWKRDRTIETDDRPLRRLELEGGLPARTASSIRAVFPLPPAHDEPYGH